MKNLRFLPLLAVGGFAADCSTTCDPAIQICDTDSDTDTGTDDFCFDCELLIDFVDVACNDNNNGSNVDHSAPNDDVITYTVETGAWAGTVEVAFIDTGDGNFPGNMGVVWDESKVFPTTSNDSFCADGSCDVWIHDLAESGTTTVTDSTTFLNCAWYATNTDGLLRGLAAKATVYDEATPTVEADCVIWGHEADHASAYGSDGCACAEDWISPAVTNPCGDHT